MRNSSASSTLAQLERERDATPPMIRPSRPVTLQRRVRGAKGGG